MTVSFDDKSSWPGALAGSRTRILAATAIAAAVISSAAVVTIAVRGPTSITKLEPGWPATFLIAALIMTAWWATYSWLYANLARNPRRTGAWMAWPLALLSLSILPDAAVVFSGRLPYSLVFDEDTFRQFRYLAAGILGLAVLAEEALLLSAARGESPAAIVPGLLGRRTATRTPRSTTGPNLTRWLPIAGLVAIIAVGMKLRIDTLDSFHGGDMDVMLSLTYNLLGWPPVHYYHSYMSQSWVYNHFPFFPIVLAPFYWLFENLLHVPTVWAVKLLIGASDIGIAMLLLRASGNGIRRWFGLAVAALWMLSPWVVGGDDHPISFAIFFALLALASLDRPWLCGLALALGVSSRNEVAFLAIPLIVHFVARRPLAQSATFIGVCGTVFALITLPFVLFDPAAMMYALVGQLQRDASTVQSMLYSGLAPHLTSGAASFLRYNPSVPALACTTIVSATAIRDGRVERVVLLVALVYLITLPLLYERYFLFTFALALYYSVRYSNPALAVAALLIAWPEFPYVSLIVLGLLLVLAASVVFRPVAPPPVSTGAAL